MSSAIPENMEIEFPTECHFKVIAYDIEGVHKNLNKCLLDLGLPNHAFQPSNKSKKGKYISYEKSVVVENHARMTEIDTAIRLVEGVKMVL
jgi:putative lipoic acid-binding regulatory protein